MMAWTGLESFDRTLYGTHVRLRDVMDEMGVEDRHRAQRMLKAVLHTLRDSDLDVEAVTAGVFRVISRHVSQGAVQDMLHPLPADIRRLWPEDARTAPAEA